MHLTLMVEMIESGLADRPLLGSGDDRVDGAGLARLARAAGGAIDATGCSAVVYVGENHPLLPVLLLGAAFAGMPYVPVNYRLDDEQLGGLVGRYPGALLLADERSTARLRGAGHAVEVLGPWLDALALGAEPGSVDAGSEDDVAVALFTSGTTSEPKSALLRHRHLMAYLLGTVEFASAGEDEAVLVSVPPYHVAGVANLLSNLYAGRRIVYLPSFDAATWLATVRAEGITNAMVVPTMLSRIVAELDGRPADVPKLRSLAYGGAKLAEPVLRAALDAFPATGFVNAYGLTETASTIAVLGPDDHRAAVTSDDPHARGRLASVGRLLPGIEIEIRDDDGRPLAGREVGLIHLRGAQVSGEYATGSLLDANGWFCTRDRGYVDADGYLFIEGRADDTIIRGGENIAPAEIEDVLLDQPSVAEACVVGVPDEEWGQRIVAVVVASGRGRVDEEELREAVRARLRGSKTPDRVIVEASLPHTETGKLLRRRVLEDVSALLDNATS